MDSVFEASNRQVTSVLGGVWKLQAPAAFGIFKFLQVNHVTLLGEASIIKKTVFFINSERLETVEIVVTEGTEETVKTVKTRNTTKFLVMKKKQN